MAASGATPYLAKKAREKSGDQPTQDAEWELDGISVPGILIRGTPLTKFSEKKGKLPKERLFRLDADQGLMLWDSKRRGLINIENIKELRLGPNAHSEIALLLPHQSLSNVEDRWLTIIYTIEDAYKTLHVIAPTADILKQWYNTLSQLRQLRLDFMSGVFHPSASSGEIWNRHHFAGADTSNDKRLDFKELKTLCQRLNFGGKESEIKRRFEEADKEGNKTLSYDEFKDFVARLRERPEVERIFKDLKGSGDFTLKVFEDFMKNVQKSTLSSEELGRIYRQFVPPPVEAGAVVAHDAKSTPWSIESFTAFLHSGYNSAFSDQVTPPPTSDAPSVTSAPHKSDIYQDMTMPLSSYFISSSHNTYLVGNQLVGTSSVEGYVRALLGGCRSVEMDIYDGPEGLGGGFGITMSNNLSTELGDITGEVQDAVEAATEAVETGSFLGSTQAPPEQKAAIATYKGIIPGEPIVTHGGTLTSSLSVRRICEAIERYAFVASPYPVIISGELHCSIAQQKVLVKVMREVFGNKLVVAPIEGDDADIILPSPEALKGRILLKAKNKLLETQSKVDAVEPDEEEKEAVPKAEASHPSKEKSGGLMGKMLGFIHGRGKSAERTKGSDRGSSPNPASGHTTAESTPARVPSTAAKVPEVTVSLPTLTSQPTSATPNPSQIPPPAPKLHIGTVADEQHQGKESSQTASRAATPIGKQVMAPELVPLLVYTSGVSYRGLSPNAGYAPYQVFSLSENRAKSLIHNPKEAGVKDSLKSSAQDSALLVEHTKEHLVRVYPKGTRVDSSNYEPNVFWAVGCQLVTQNWQTVDHGWHINRAMYLRNGGAGYVLKPPALLDPSYPFDHKVHRRTKHLLHVRVISAQQLPRPKDHQGQELIDKDTVDPYVKITIHIPIWASGQSSESVAPVPVAPIITKPPPGSAAAAKDPSHELVPGEVISKSSQQKAVLVESGPAGEEQAGAAVGEREVKVKTKTILNNGFNPVWEEKLTLPFDVFGEGMKDLIFVRFLVKDDNLEKDDFVGGYCTSLGTLQLGYRHLPLYDEQVSQILFSSLFVHISIEDL